MSKICTDLEQSRKLLSLGIDKNTADMHYFSDGYNPTKLDVGYSAENAKFYRGTENKYIPAWSLTALLELMPRVLRGVQSKYDKEPDDAYLTIRYNDYYYSIVEGETEAKFIVGIFCEYKFDAYWLEPFHMEVSDNYFEVVFEMVCWLLENGYIKKV